MTNVTVVPLTGQSPLARSIRAQRDTFRKHLWLTDVPARQSLRLEDKNTHLPAEPVSQPAKAYCFRGKSRADIHPCRIVDSENPPAAGKASVSDSTCSEEEERT